MTKKEYEKSLCKYPAALTATEVSEIGQDVPLINVSNFLGHSDLSTTANIYAHLDKASKQGSADVITEILNKAKD